ncbi:hypothetical protein MNBD_GAMMA15-1461 [hydrothermal vent metagenome]|uniref:DUF3024 domain-containing protein n=1 Tax=hydrothermal vent metagenome TaxID=652676 RepID=A0A3B0YA19_9ZZZZ
MNVSNLALQRAKRQLESFCVERSCPGDTLTCLLENDSLLLANNEQALVRLQLDGARWRIFWRRDKGQWEPWPHLPVCDDMQQVIEQLDQAPLHVHWSG